MVDKNPKYNGLHVFKINVAKLNAGDVLLTRNVEATTYKAALQSSAIMKATGGTFSHAMLCTVPPTFIEAIGHGVSNLSVLNCFAHDLKNVRMLRYHDQTIAKTAGSGALPLLGQKYSVRKAVRSILPNTKMTDVSDDELFCSALVAAAFRKAGAKELQSVDPMKVTPAVLEKATFFTDITDAVFSRILSPNNIEEMSALDGDRAPTPLGAQAELFQDYCSVLLPMIRDYIASTPQITFTKIPSSFMECVMFIGAACRVSGNMNTSAATDQKEKIAKIDDIAFKMLTDQRFEEMQRAAIASDEESLQYTIAQSFLSDPDIDLEDTRSLIAVTREQISSRSSILEFEGLEVSRSGKKWLEISANTVEALKRRMAALEESFRRAFPKEPL